MISASIREYNRRNGFFPEFFCATAKLFLHAKILRAIPDTLPVLLARRAPIDRGRIVSFRELAAESGSIAQGLLRLGPPAGDRVRKGGLREMAEALLH
jgi:hypothetical protein